MTPALKKVPLLNHCFRFTSWLEAGKPRLKNLCKEATSLFQGRAILLHVCVRKKLKTQLYTVQKVAELTSKQKRSLEKPLPEISLSSPGRKGFTISNPSPQQSNLVNWQVKELHLKIKIAKFHISVLYLHQESILPVSNLRQPHCWQKPLIRFYTMCTILPGLRKRKQHTAERNEVKKGFRAYSVIPQYIEDVAQKNKRACC